ncbi:hypothetical protein Tco_0786051 [Tanacetum coccineum]
MQGSRGLCPLAGSRGRAPCWGPAARSAGGGRGGPPLVGVWGQLPDPNGIFGVPKMGLLAFIHVVDPTKVKVGERERANEEARLLDSTVRRVVSLLLIAPNRADSELEASMEKLFDESGGADQRDSIAGGGQEIEAEIVVGVRFVDEDNVVAEKPKRPQKKRQAATDVSGFSHPLKKLRSDHGTSSGAASAEAVATLPFVTSSVSATPEHESGIPTDSITGLNLRTIGASKRFVISSDSSHHSSINVPGAEGDSFIRSVVVPPVMTEEVITTHVASIHSAMAPESGTKVITPVHASMFHDSESTGTEVDYESLYEVFVPHWNIPNDSLVDNLNASREFIDHLAPPVLFAQIRDMDYEELFTEFSVGTAQVEAAEKNMALEDEKKSLSGKVMELQSMISIKDRKLKDVGATITSLKSQNDGLTDQRLEEFQNVELKVVNERVEKLDDNLAEMACHLEEKFYPHLLTTIFGRGEPFNHGLEACSSGIDPWQGTGEKLADIVAYKPSVTCGFQFCPTRALPLADAPSMGRLQHDIEQLKVPIHSTSISVPGATGTTTALSTTFASASSIPPISVKDY